MPGPTPLDRPAFPDQFRDECRSLVRRRTVPHDQRQRARLVLLLHESPDLSNVAAGALVELHANSVHRWRHRWACGNFCLADKAGRGMQARFSPRDRAIVKAIACEAVCQTKLPLSRLSTSDLANRTSMALGRSISPSTVWRILDTDAIKPWRYQYWIFPRDPKFSEKAERVWTCMLAPGMANRWAAGTTSSAPTRRRASRLESDATRLCLRVRGRPMRVEHEYERGGALQYLAAWDVRRGRVLGRCEDKTGIDSFGRLVDQVMRTEPYRSASRVFWVVDNGSSHRGQAAIRRLRKAYRKAVLVHTPVHASWLNQVEIYFSIIQRKVLTPNDFASLEEVEQRLRLYEELSNREPRRFQWKFDRSALLKFLARLEAKHELVF